MVDAATRNLVQKRAGNQCEYCRLPQAAVDVTFHIEHIIARQHAEYEGPENLALACHRCNLHKGTNLSSVDPQSEAVEPKCTVVDPHLAERVASEANPPVAVHHDATMGNDDAPGALLPDH